MINRVRIKNCLSFVDFDIRLGKMNLLVGKNNTGKSNFCHVLQFLRLSTMHSSIDTALIGSMGGTARVTNIKSNDPLSSFYIECSLPASSNSKDGITYKYELVIERNADSQPGQLYLVRKEILKAKSGEREEVLIRNLRGEFVALKNQGNGKMLEKDRIKPSNKTALSTFQTDKYRKIVNFKEFLGGIQNFDLQPISLEKPDITRPYTYLEGHGENLFGSLYILKTHNKKLYNQYMKKLGEIDPKCGKMDLVLQSINTVEPVFAFSKGKTLYRHSLSDGTLRLMGHLLIAYWYEYLAKQRNQSMTATIDEIENGVHVGLMREIYEIYKETPAQFIITTHAPYFIDFFDENLDGVKFLDKSDKGTVIRELNKPRINRLLNEEMSLGEIHFREILGP